MKIDSVDVFYLSMPVVEDIADGSQDMLLARVRAGGLTGWGECESAPLPGIAALVCPLSSSSCHPVIESVLGEPLSGPEDVRRIGDLVRVRSLDLLQADHTLSGIEIALWDLLGKSRGQPVYELLGYREAYPKTPYASQLFGEEPQETLWKARRCQEDGFVAVKFGWGPYGRGTVSADADQVHAAREGLGPDGILLVDAGAVWVEDVDTAAARLPALQDVRALWLEEPFVGGALRSYKALAAVSGSVRLAGGENSHNRFQAEHMIDSGAVGFIQIDAGRIGGIAPASDVAAYATAKDVQFVNHTFTSHLTLSASLQPFAGLAHADLCEYPVEMKSLARALIANRLDPDSNGQIRAPEAPGLGMTLDLEAVEQYLQDVEVSVRGRTLYRTPKLEP
jgi:L-alanine-DL-glutamate epimerase-like enolase superfamily enzyme